MRRFKQSETSFELIHQVAASVARRALLANHYTCDFDLDTKHRKVEYTLGEGGGDVESYMVTYTIQTVIQWEVEDIEVEVIINDNLFPPKQSRVVKGTVSIKNPFLLPCQSTFEVQITDYPSPSMGERVKFGGVLSTIEMIG